MMSASPTAEKKMGGSDGSMQGDIVRFAPLQSTIEASFWSRLFHLKLHGLKLSEEIVPLCGTYTPSSSIAGASSQSARVRFDHESLASVDDDCLEGGGPRNSYEECDHRAVNLNVRNESISCWGTIQVFNTLEGFKRADKAAILSNHFHPLLRSCCSTPESGSTCSGSAEHQEGTPDMSVLSTLHCITFVDLKKHTALYWFLYPALCPRNPVRYAKTSAGVRALTSVVGVRISSALAAAVYRMRLEQLIAGDISTQGPLPPYFIILNLLRLEGEGKDIDICDKFPIKCIPLSATPFSTLSGDDISHSAFAFFDPCNVPDTPGWPMRNLIAFLSLKLGISGEVKFVSFRPSSKRWRRISSETIASYRDESSKSDFEGLKASHFDVNNDESLLLSVVLEPHDFCTDTSVVGWELNAKVSKPSPKMVDLSSLFDQSQLASQSVDLNLSLMRWRALPALNLGLLKNDVKCLLLGAGTLGCGVARTLLGWGVRNISFVDNGRVGYSNPVRQSLYETKDCAGSGRYKVEAAVDALERILPGVNVKGLVLSIPMPGHPVSAQNRKELDAGVELLDKLVREHNVVFLLTDTRESRWLPTLLAATYDKMLINVALGLESWLVMRHGEGLSALITTGSSDVEGAQSKARLGCYFCNDVVAPENSTKERTLDEQCTVTRPGLAPIASAMAVELMVSLLHHEERHHASASNNRECQKAESESGSDSKRTSPLGLVPHQIRGFLSTFSLMMPSTPAFSCCTACSAHVVNKYKLEGADFVQRVSQDTGGVYLEKLTGLAQFKEATVLWDLDDDEVGL